MASYYKEEIPMLSDTIPPLENDDVDSQFRAAPMRNRSASISIPMDSLEPPQYEAQLVGFTGPLRRERIAPLPQKSGPLYINRNGDLTSQPNQERMTTEMLDLKPKKLLPVDAAEPNGWYKDKYPSKNEHLLKSGQLGMCNDPYCTTCPSYYSAKASQQKHSKVSFSLESRFPNGLYGDAKGWTRRFVSCLKLRIPGIMNPHTRRVQRWNKFFVISCLVAIFVDPLFFFVLSVLNDKKCIVINWNLTLTIVVFRSLADFIYLLHMLLQFRLAYVAPESRVVGAGELVDTPKKIAIHYFRGFFFLDLFIVLPLPQIIVLLILPKNLGASGANYAKNLLRAAILLQYIPRLFRFLPLLIGQSPNGFIFETARANFVINLLTFVLSGHVVGACWYLFGLQRVNQCLRDACIQSDSKKYCKDFIDCGYGDSHPFFNDPFFNESIWSSWKKNENATACFTTEGNFSYGIYNQAINLTTKQSIATRYIYSLFWGFQQISTLAGNQVPSYFIWEVLFTMAIVGLGLLLFAFLIGNMQNFLQALGQRRLEMSLRRRDVEQWMSHRRLPLELRRKVLEAERYNWAATRGVNEEVLLDSIPEDLQRDIRAHLFSFVRQVWIFKQMDDHVLDAICERLKQKIYIKGSKILHQSGLIDKMLFIVRGKLVSVGEDCTPLSLTHGDVCGEELLTWCLDNTSINKDERKIKAAGHRLLSSRTVTCLTNVEAFALRESDLEEVTSLFARNLRHPRIQGAIRYQSPYWRTSAAMRVQVAWRYRQKRLKRGNTSVSNANY